MPTAVWQLSWFDVEPATHRFSAADVERVARAALTGRNLRGDTNRRGTEDAVDRALMAEFGWWMAGWRWTASEPGCGGPVQGYCCAPHSLGPGADEAVAGVVAAARSWRARLEELAVDFEVLRAEGAGLEPEEDACRAASQLLPLVLEWTDAEDAWYGTFERILAWYLEPVLGDSVVAKEVVQRAIGGRFESWISPGEEIEAEVVASVGEAVGVEVRGEGEVVDALARWLEIREGIRWQRKRFCTVETVEVDGHLAFVEARDRARGGERAERMVAAIELVRAAALGGEELSVGMLSDWQRVVLGEEEVGLRTREAFAYGGRHRYGTEPGTWAEFERCVAEANEVGAVPVVGLAARVYLDVLFFHPFEDGNARAARLALDYVLTRAGLALHTAEPVFVVARSAFDPWGPYSFIHVIDYLSGDGRETRGNATRTVK
jgi:hypothetical protein